MAGVADQEFVFRFPDEEFGLSARKKRSSAASTATGRRSSGRPALRRTNSGGSRHSTKTARGSQSAGLAPSSAASHNPRNDYDRRSRGNTSHPLRGMKSQVLTRKLETGFNLTWINGGSKSQAVILSTNSDKTYLRIRIRSKDEEESENDGGKANQRDLKFKVRHIAKIGSERESAADRNRPEKPKNKSFVIKMKYPVGEFTKFKFLAQSLAERDSVLLAIKSILDHGKQQQHASHPSKSQAIEFEMRSDPVNVKSFKALQISERNAIVDEDADSLTIPAPKNLIDAPEEEDIFYDTRDEPTTHARSIGDADRDDDLHVFGRSAELNAFQRENGASRPYDNSSYYNKSVTREDPATMAKLNRNRPDKWMEKKTTDSHRRTATSDMAGPGKGRKYQPASKMIQNKQKARMQKILESQRNSADSDSSHSSMKEMTDAKLPESSYACNPSQALSALEDVDISNLAADFTNPVVGPWCTDDICTASLRDFADSMTGIFDIKDNRQTKGVNKVNRAKAENYISGFLGDNTNMSELLSVRDLWNVAANKHATGEELKKIHNRARKSSGQAKRLANLRKQMTFAGGDQRNASTLQTISSFDDVHRKKTETEDDDLLYYDSDPEDSRERTFRKGPREVMARREEEDIRSRVKRREALDILDTTRFGLGRRWRRAGQDVLSDIIEATKNEKITLLWHPTKNSESNGNMPPVCVNIWVESGIYLTDGSFLLPKLSWLPAHEKNLENRVMNISDRNPGSLDLLDVCRVKECETIDRDLYPLANTERCFVIQTQNARYIFEAQSKQERGRVVNGLKLVIARLASLLMLKDLRAVDEFFGGNQVPGEAPIWARGDDRSDSDDGFPSA